MVETLEKGREEIFRILALDLRGCFRKGKFSYEKLQEIRLRVGMPLLVIYDGREFFLSEKGELSNKREKGVLVTTSHIQETMEYACNYSMYAFEKELSEGYITIRGGHRIGVAGKIVQERNGTRGMQHISFLNIRLAHEVMGCGDVVLPYLLKNGTFCHSLILSPPGCGKTTLLRDLVRQLSNGNWKHEGMTVGVVDERSEIGASYQGKPQNDLGCRTDVLDGCTKVKGMMMLVRSMAPQIIAVDEIGSREDVEAIEYVMNCGVRLLATVHGNSIDDIKNKPVLGRLMKERLFERYIVLQAGQIGKIQAVFDERGSLLFSACHGDAFQVVTAC